MPITILKKEIPALLDTGAYNSCMDYTFFRKEFPELDLYAPERVEAFGVGNHKLDIVGIAELPISYQDRNGQQQTITLSAMVIQPTKTLSFLDEISYRELC